MANQVAEQLNQAMDKVRTKWDAARKQALGSLSAGGNKLAGFEQKARAQLVELEQKARAQVSGLEQKAKAQVGGLEQKTKVQLAELEQKTKAQVGGLEQQARSRFTELEQRVRGTVGSYIEAWRRRAGQAEQVVEAAAAEVLSDVPEELRGGWAVVNERLRAGLDLATLATRSELARLSTQVEALAAARVEELGQLAGRIDELAEAVERLGQRQGGNKRKEKAPQA